MVQWCAADAVTGAVCSGHGSCLSGIGKCLCFEGYAGDECDACEAQYTARRGSAGHTLCVFLPGGGSCRNGVRDGHELGVDCGGVCSPCNGNDTMSLSDSPGVGGSSPGHEASGTFVLIASVCGVIGAVVIAAALVLVRRRRARRLERQTQPTRRGSRGHDVSSRKRHSGAGSSCPVYPGPGFAASGPSRCDSGDRAIATAAAILPGVTHYPLATLTPAADSAQSGTLKNGTSCGFDFHAQVAEDFQLKRDLVNGLLESSRRGLLVRGRREDTPDVSNRCLTPTSVTGGFGSDRQSPLGPSRDDEFDGCRLGLNSAPRSTSRKVHFAPELRLHPASFTSSSNRSIPSPSPRTLTTVHVQPAGTSHGGAPR